MEAWFARLKALVTSMASDMAAHVKPTALAPCDSSVQGFNLGFFCGARFLGPLGPDEIKSSIFDDHVLEAVDDKTLVKVSIVAPITKANA
jgi:hypothetical protein